MKRPIPLSEVLGKSPASAPRGVPSWLEPRPAPAKTRPLRAYSQPAPAVQPAEDSIRADMERRAADTMRAAELEGLRAAEEQIAMVIERFLDAARRMADAARVARRPNAEEVVDLALTVARELLGRETSVDRDRLAAAVDSALASVTVDASVTIRLAPADLAFMRARRPELAGAGVSFIDDAALHAGDFVVETPQVLIDGAAVARLEGMRAALVGLIAESGALPAGEGV